MRVTIRFVPFSPRFDVFVDSIDDPKSQRYQSLREHIASHPKYSTPLRTTGTLARVSEAFPRSKSRHDRLALGNFPVRRLNAAQVDRVATPAFSNRDNNTSPAFETRNQARSAISSIEFLPRTSVENLRLV